MKFLSNIIMDYIKDQGQTIHTVHNHAKFVEEEQRQALGIAWQSCD